MGGRYIVHRGSYPFVFVNLNFVELINKPRCCFVNSGCIVLVKVGNDYVIAMAV